MKRLIIITIIIVAAFMIFDKKEPKVVTEPEEIIETEEILNEENIEEQEQIDTEIQKPVPAPPTSPNLIEEVPEDINTKEEIIAKPVIIKEQPKKEVIVPKKERVKIPDYSFDSRVRTYLYEWDIDFSEGSVPAGNIAFEITNNGQFAHYFSIKDVADFGKVVPGETRVFTIKLDEGEFEIYSPRDIDISNKMRKTFRVGK